VGSSDEDNMAPSTSVEMRKVLVVEDHPVTREALVALLTAEPDFTICGEVETVADAVPLLAASPDIVLVDLLLGQDDGFDLLATMRSRYPQIPALVVSSRDPEVFGERVRAAGAKGFVPKHEVPARLVDTIRHILDGGAGG